jgi:hypothetical protein
MNPHKKSKITSRHPHKYGSPDKMSGQAVQREFTFSATVW